MTDIETRVTELMQEAVAGRSGRPDVAAVMTQRSDAPTATPKERGKDRADLYLVSLAAAVLLVVGVATWSLTSRDADVAGQPVEVGRSDVPTDSDPVEEFSTLGLELPDDLGLSVIPDVTVPVGSATFFVDAINGNDDSLGTSVDGAWKSLGKGLDALAPGVDVFVLDGVYDELRSPNQAHYVIENKRGSVDEWSRLLAYPGHRPKIVATSTSGIEILSSDFVEVSGFKIEGFGFGPDNAQGYGIVARDGHHFVFRDNEIYGMGNSGIGSGQNSSHLTIANNVIYENALWSPDGSSGISLWRLTDVGPGDDPAGYSNRIVGNTIYANENRVNCSCSGGESITDGNGIIIDQSKINGYSGRTLIRNNVIFNNGGRAINVHESSRVDIVNNTTYKNAFTEELAGERSEVSTYNSEDVAIENNLLVPAAGLEAISTNGEIRSVDNAIVGESSTGEDNQRIDDPQFVSPSTDPQAIDLRLSDSSPIFDAGLGPVGAQQEDETEQDYTWDGPAPFGTLPDGSPDNEKVHPDSIGPAQFIEINTAVVQCHVDAGYEAALTGDGRFGFTTNAPDAVTDLCDAKFPITAPTELTIQRWEALYAANLRWADCLTQQGIDIPTPPTQSVWIASSGAAWSPSAFVWDGSDEQNWRLQTTCPAPG